MWLWIVLAAWGGFMLGFFMAALFAAAGREVEYD